MCRISSSRIDFRKRWPSTYENAAKYNGQLKAPSTMKPEREKVFALCKDGYEKTEKHILFFKEKKEKDLSIAIEQKSVELIITSDCNNWIPEEYKNESKELFLICLRDLMKCSKIAVKDKMRYGIYRLGGNKIYKRFVLAGKSL